MPITPAQLAAGANRSLMTYADNNPIDQFTPDQPFVNWLIANKKESQFGNGIFNEKVRINNSSNYQNYTRDQQVSYNTKDTVRLAPFQHYEAHDGFSINETDLADNGIVMTDDRNNVPSESEMIQIINIMEENYETLKNGFQQNFDLEVHRDGTQSSLAVPGLDLLVSTTPAVGVVGGLDAALYPFWRNQAFLNINTGTVGALTDAMEQAWRACMTVGRKKPDKIICGQAFLDAYRKDSPQTVNRQLNLTTDKTGGFKVENGVTGIYFKGVEVEWDPTFEILQTLLAPTISWSKRCYFLHSKTMILRPNKGRWMVKREPPRIYDRYTHFFAITNDYGLTVKQRNNLAVLSIL